MKAKKTTSKEVIISTPVDKKQVALLKGEIHQKEGKQKRIDYIEVLKISFDKPVEQKRNLAMVFDRLSFKFGLVKSDRDSYINKVVKALLKEGFWLFSAKSTEYKLQLIIIEHTQVELNLN